MSTDQFSALTEEREMLLRHTACTTLENTLALKGLIPGQLVQLSYGDHMEAMTVEIHNYSMLNFSQFHVRFEFFFFFFFL